MTCVWVSDPHHATPSNTGIASIKEPFEKKIESYFLLSTSTTLPFQTINAIANKWIQRNIPEKKWIKIEAAKLETSSFVFLEITIVKKESELIRDLFLPGKFAR